MKTKEIREMTVPELSKKMEDTRVTLFNLSIRKQTTRAGKPHEFKTLRRDIARMQTILTEKEERKA